MADSIYKRWVLKYHSDVQDKNLVKFPQHTVESSAEGKLPEYVCLWGQFRGSSKGIYLWLRTTKHPGGVGDRIHVSRGLLESKGVDFNNNDFDPDSENSSALAYVTLLPRTSVQNILHWIKDTQTGRFETAKLVVGLSIVALGVFLNFGYMGENAPDWLPGVIIVSGIVLAIQSGIVFWQKYGRTD